MNNRRARGNKEAKKPKQGPRAPALADATDRPPAPGARAKPPLGKK